MFSTIFGFPKIWRNSKILVFPEEFRGFLASDVLQVGVDVGPRLGRPPRSILDRFWEVLGGQDAHKTAQDGAKTGQYGAKTPPRWLQDAPKTS